MIVGIDVGTTKVCTLIADVSRDLTEVLGVGIAPSQGVKRGVIVDVEAAVDAISASLRRAEQQSGFKAMSAFVGVSGAHILSTNSHAVINLRPAESVIGFDDVSRVIDGTRIVQLPPDQEIVHVVPRHFIVDGRDGLANPVGMTGHRLEVEANIVTGSVTSIHNLMRCIQPVHVELDALVLEPLAAGKAVLTDEEQMQGAMVIDIGGGTTGAAVFRDGSLIHSCVLPVGGFQISNDLAIGLRATFQIAEEVKVRHGSTIEYASGNGQMVTIPDYGRGEGHSVDQRIAAEIIDARLAETFELVQEQMLRAGFGYAYPAGVVITGGSSQIPGTAALAFEVFGVPCRLGAPRRLHGLADAVRGPAFSTSVGLIEWGREQLDQSTQTEPSTGVGRAGATIRAWLRNFFA
ncbi:MAG: ftsA [Chloroflexi bacterium]|nr:ftsA [Chloroflexota bacterium]